MSRSAPTALDPTKTDKRSCIWCDETNLSAEHVLPQWLNRMVQSTESSRRTVKFDLLDGQLHEERHKQGSVFTVRPRVVCRRCNNEWMGRLEEQAIPVLTPLVQGKPTVISPDEAAIVASSAMKTAIIAQNVGELATSRAQCTTFKDTLVPVRHTKMWIGRFGEPERGNVWTYAWPWHKDERRQARTRSAATANSHLTILAAGHLLLLVAHSPDPSFRYYEPMGFSAHQLLALWPDPAQIRWPPTIATTEAGVLHLRQTLATFLNS